MCKQLKKLSRQEFRRKVGIKKDTFKKMVNMFMRCKAKQVTYVQEDTWKELAKKYPDENLEIVRAMLKEGDGEEVHGCMFCIV